MKNFRLGLLAVCSSLLFLGTSAQWTGDSTVNNIVHASPGNDNLIHSCPDENGNTLIVFQKDRKIYAQKVGTQGQLLWGNASDALLAGDESSEKAGARAIYDSANGLFVAWSQIASATDTAIYVQHIDSDGNKLYGVAGTRITSALNTNFANPILSVANDKALFVGFTEYNFPSKTIKARINKVTSAGGILWGMGGKVIQAAQGFNTVIGVVSTTSNAFLVYESSRNDVSNGTNYSAYLPKFSANIQLNKDIYCQRISGSTGAELQVNDIAVCTNYRFQGMSSAFGNWHNAIPDGNGGVIVAFFDYRNQNPSDPYPYFFTLDIYAQRISRTGVKLWAGGTEDALRISYDHFFPSITNEQIHMVPDGGGGAFIGWAVTPTYEGVIDLRHILPAGDVTWNTFINRASNLSITKKDPATLVVTYDSASFPYTQMAQMIDENGFTKWGTGKVVSKGKGRDSNYRLGLFITNAASGNFNICWTDGRNTINGRDIYISQINGTDGSLVSTLNPTANSSAPGYWTDISSWAGGLLPNETTDVVITHNITVTGDVVCKSLTVVPPATITVLPGCKVKVKN